MEFPLVSVALCTYNGARFLRTQLDSIVNQTYPALELIIVDDCSTDDTVEIIRNFQADHRFIRLYENASNLGVVKNFEIALSLCEGDLIALADQDDIWDPCKIEKQVNNIKTNVMLYHDSEFIDEHGNPIHKRLSDVVNFYRGSTPESFLYFNSISGHAMLMKKTVRDAALPFPEVYYHDWWLAYVAANLGAIDYLEESLVKYRQHFFSNTDILKRRRSEKRSSSDHRWKTKVYWIEACSQFRHNRDPKLVRQISNAVSSRNSLRILGLFIKHWDVLFANNDKSTGSRLNFVIKQVFGK